MVKEAYYKLKKKYHFLPAFAELNNEFEIINIENTDFLAREIRRKIGEKFSLFMDRLARTLQPESISISEFYEFHCFTAEEKTKLFLLFKELRFKYRHFMHLDLLVDDKKEAEAVRDSLKFWKEFRKKLIPYFKTLELCWVKEYKEKEILEYLG
ncbi:hypothetical protein JW851_02630 [Candidatus Woesearchaeota archaeon]|nr:hypothetical protein [Candidatus Woesearchaeota archaeon]